MDKITVTCQCDDYLPVEELEEFQGGLKIRTQTDLQKIKNSILKHGIAVPFFVWKHQEKNYILDGHGRFEVLKNMKKSGSGVDKVPVIYINCETESKAKDLLLRMNSEYGTMTKQSILDFLGHDFNLNVDDYSLSIGHIDLGIGRNPVQAFAEAPEPYERPMSEETDTNITASNTYIPSPVIETDLDRADATELRSGIEAVMKREEVSPVIDSTSVAQPPQRTVYILRVNDIVYKADLQEYNLFLSFAKDYSSKNFTLIGVINELFAQCSNRL